MKYTFNESSIESKLRPEQIHEEFIDALLDIMTKNIDIDNLGARHPYTTTTNIINYIEDNGYEKDKIFENEKIKEKVVADIELFLSNFDNLNVEYMNYFKNILKYPIFDQILIEYPDLKSIAIVAVLNTLIIHQYLNTFLFRKI